MKIEAKLEDKDNVMGRLKWLEENLGEVRRYTLQRLCEELADLLNNPEHLHYVKVTRGADDYYGISLEPPLERRSFKQIEDKALIYVLTDSKGSTSKLGKWAERGNPWIASKAPRGLGINKDEGFWFLRDVSQSELDAISAYNQEYLDKNRGFYQPTTTASLSVWCVEDEQYNQARAEFGFDLGAKLSSGSTQGPVWKPALRQLIKERVPKIMDEAIEAMIAAKVPLLSVEFEDRDDEWLERHEPFVLVLTTA